MVVDLENLCGGSDHVEANAGRAYKALSTIIPMDRAQVVVGVGVHAFTTCPYLGFQWPGSRIVVGRGIDGADQRLVEDLIDEPQAARSSTVVIASGDKYFADAARSLRSRGVHVVVVARQFSLASSLKEAASEVRYIPLNAV